MKKTYIQPVVETNLTEATEMLAESLPIIKGTSVNGKNTLVKKNDWDIFGTEDEEPVD